TKLSANLDFLRAVAVLLVLAQHLLRRFEVGARIPAIGTFGVFIFFVHTCLVLMYSMERSGLGGKALFGNFYIRRIFRIYPLCILWLLSIVSAVIQMKLAPLTGPSSMVRRMTLLQMVPNFLPGVIAFVLPHTPKMKSFLWPVLILMLAGVYVAWPVTSIGWI